MKDEVKEIMLEHLKLLQEAAEKCEDEMLEPITRAMVMTAGFLISEEKEPAEQSEVKTEEQYFNYILIRLKRPFKGVFYITKILGGTP